MHIIEWTSVEHREEVDEKIQRKVRYFLWNRQFNKEAKEGRMFAASAAIITEETTGSEDRNTRQEKFWWQSTAT